MGLEMLIYTRHLETNSGGKSIIDPNVNIFCLVMFIEYIKIV